MRVRSGWGYEASVEDVVVPGVLMEEENSYYRNTALKIIYGLCLGPPDLHRCRAIGSPLWYSKLFTSTAVEMPQTIRHRLISLHFWERPYNHRSIQEHVLRVADIDALKSSKFHSSSSANSTPKISCTSI